jgi:hypothetical protein
MSLHGELYAAALAGGCALRVAGFHMVKFAFHIAKVYALQRSKNSPYGRNAFRHVENAGKSLIDINFISCLI